MEVTKHGGGEHCMLRAYEGEHVTPAIEKERFQDLATIRACQPSTLVRSLSDYAIYFMTEAGSKAVRRGVRVPLVYWKVASWKDKERKKSVFCCWLMDQTGMVDETDTGAGCLETVKTHGAD